MTQFIIFELLSVLFLCSANIPKSSRNITVFRIREDHLFNDLLLRVHVQVLRLLNISVFKTKNAYENYSEV